MRKNATVLIIALFILFNISTASAKGMEQIFPGWQSGSGDVEVITADDGNHIGVVSGMTAQAAITYKLEKKYTPAFKMEFKINLPVTVNENGDGTFTKVPNLAAAHIGPSSNVALNDGSFTSKVTAEEITDGSMPDMGEDRAWYSYKWTGKGYWYENYSSFGIRANKGYVVYVDDIKFIRNDGGGSDTTLHTEDFEYYYYGDSSGVKMFAVNGTGENIVITWRNPSVVAQGFQILENGVDITENTEFDLTADAYNSFTYNPLFDEVKTYELVMTVNGEQKSKKAVARKGSKFSKSTSTTDGVPLEGWSLSAKDAELPFYGGVYLDEYNKISGQYALKINPSILNASGSAFSGAWNGSSMTLHMQTKEELKPEQTYKLSYKLKVLNGRGLRNAYSAAGVDDITSSELISGTSAVSHNWKDVEFIFTPQSIQNADIKFVFEGAAENIWIDDVALNECDSDGNVTAEDNLAVNGSLDNEIQWPDYEISGNGIFNGDVEMASLEEGTYKAKVNVKNLKIDAGLDVQLMTILKKDGSLLCAGASQITNISKSEASDYPEEISLPVTIPDLSDGNYELYVFVWDSLEEMNILTPVKVIKEAE